MKKLSLLLFFCLPLATFAQEKSSKKEDESVFLSVEQMPEFPGAENGLFDFIRTTVHYPDSAREHNKTGTVFVDFIVSKTGKCTDAKIRKSVDPYLDAEALRVVKLLPDWKPGKQGGKNVNVQFTVPISFNLR